MSIRLKPAFLSLRSLGSPSHIVNFLVDRLTHPRRSDCAYRRSACAYRRSACAYRRSDGLLHQLCAPGTLTAQLCASGFSMAQLCAPGTLAAQLCAPGTLAAQLCALVPSAQLCAPGTLAAQLCASGTLAAQLCAPGTLAAQLCAPGTLAAQLCASGTRLVCHALQAMRPRRPVFVMLPRPCAPACLYLSCFPGHAPSHACYRPKRRGLLQIAL